MKLSGDATVDTISFRKPDWISRHPVLKRSQRYSFSFFFSSAAERRKAYRRTAIPVQRNNKTLLEFWSGQVALPSSKQWAQVPHSLPTRIAPGRARRASAPAVDSAASTQPRVIPVSSDSATNVPFFSFRCFFRSSLGRGPEPQVLFGCLVMQFPSNLFTLGSVQRRTISGSAGDCGRAWSAGGVEEGCVFPFLGDLGCASTTIGGAKECLKGRFHLPGRLSRRRH